MRFCLCLTLSLASWSAFARGGTGAANAEYTNAKNVKGLCTPDNKDEPYYKQGLCQSLEEQFKENECMKKDLAEMRILALGDADDPAYQRLRAQGRKNVSLPHCSGDGANQNFEKTILKDQSKFNYYFEQLIAMMTIKTSGWNVLNNDQAGSKGPSGLLDFSLGKDGLKDMEKKEYACGCKEKVATTSGQSGVTVEGQSPGPLDGHHSLTCGSYMIVKQILKDGTWRGGQAPSRASGAERSSEDSRQGASRLVASLEFKPGTDGIDESENWYTDKLTAFCKKYWSAPNSQVNRWDDDIGRSSAEGTSSRR